MRSSSLSDSSVFSDAGKKLGPVRIGYAGATGPGPPRPPLPDLQPPLALTAAGLTGGPSAGELGLPYSCFIFL